MRESGRAGSRSSALPFVALLGILADMGANQTQIEASFCEAIKIAKEQKSVPLDMRAEETCAEYRRQKASASGRRGSRLPLC
jgi:hypothetical protein